MFLLAMSMFSFGSMAYTEIAGWLKVENHKIKVPHTLSDQSREEQKFMSH